MDNVTGGLDSNGSLNGSGLTTGGIAVPITEQIIESAVLVILLLIGLVGNAFVLKRSRGVARFAKQNAYLFCGLSLSDILLCAIRIPPLLYIKFKSSSDTGLIACEVWAFSNIFIFIAILTNMVVAMERRIIIVCFQRYLSFFTPLNVLKTSIALWCTFMALSITFFVGSKQQAVLHSVYNTCLIDSTFGEISEYIYVAVNGSFVLIFGVVPICNIVYSYGSIITRIYRANLLKIDRVDEKALYSRLVNVALLRVLISIVCWPPFLVYTAIWPLFPDMQHDFPYARFVDYLVICQASISPLITVYDTDFREITAQRRWHFCSTMKSRSSEGNSFSNRRGKRTVINMTSQEMKTYGNSENLKSSPRLVNLHVQ